MTGNVSSNHQLILEQRCLHHITMVGIRNLTLQLPYHNGSAGNVLMYITGHSHNNNQKLLFQSDKINVCYNPTWSNMQFSSLNSIKITAFILRLWIETDEKNEVVKEWNVFLLNLNCCGDSLCNDKLHFNQNTAIFQLHKMFYCSSSSIVLQSDVSIGKVHRFDTVDSKLSYSINTLQKCLLSSRSTALCRNRVISLREKMNKIMDKDKEITLLKAELEVLQSYTALIKDLLRREQVFLASEKKQVATLNEMLTRKEKERKENEDSFIEETQRVRSCNEICIDTKLDTTRKFKHLALRRRDILTELSDIFPITVVYTDKENKSSKTSQASTAHAICNVKLSESETLNQREDLPASVALGYTVQLISMMSQFILVPLRYPVIQKGSQSSIVDHVTEKLSDRERIFSLYVKSSKDRFIAEYGVFLLNKNVAQLRYYCGLGTSDLKATLKNIKSLLEERLGATSNFVGSNPSKPIAILDPHKATSPKYTFDDSSRRFSTARTFDPDMDPDFPTPSSGHGGTVSPSYKHKPSTMNEFKILSPRHITQTSSQRVVGRHQDLQSLRGELLGLNDRSSRKSPDNNQTKTLVVSGDPVLAPIPTRSVSALFKSNFDMDSIESVSRGISNRALTGLEEINRFQGGKNAKLATARAELLGKRAARQSRDTTSLWSRAPTSSSYLRKRGELFRKQNLSEETFADNNDDDDNDREKGDHSCRSSMAYSDWTNDSLSSSSDATTVFGGDSNSRDQADSDKRQSNDGSDGENLTKLIEPDVVVLNPNNHSTTDNQSDEEFDLC